MRLVALYGVKWLGRKKVQMRLSEFIQSNQEEIIAEWVAFARSLLPWAEGMSEEQMRDHAVELLNAVVSDMKSPQSGHQRSEKSKGNAEDGELASVGKKHASDRLATGLNLNQLVSEYRALRASVLRLWEEAQGDKQGEVTRFNEAIDETLSTSTARYSETVDNTREQFLGILSHDLRNPIGAVTMGAALLVDSDDPNTVDIATRILDSGERMNRMVSDLLDLTRTNLGSGIPVTRKPTELASVCRQVIAELQLIHSDCPLRFEAIGDLRGEWDSDRLAQVVSNLIANALQYCAPKSPVTVLAEQRGDEVTLQVHNDGLPIPERILPTIFRPMVRHQPGGQEHDHNKSGLGLGLFIASEIVTAHEGTIKVTSTQSGGTTFVVSLPRGAGSKTTGADRPPRRRERPETDVPHL